MTSAQRAFINNHFLCVDCAVNTYDAYEYYMVNNSVWARAGMHPNGGMLCIGCLEQRLKRTLTYRDFARVPLNTDWHFMQSERLRDRLHKEPNK
jgi:hypothetical protein